MVIVALYNNTFVFLSPIKLLLFFYVYNNPVASPTSTTTQQQNKKKEEENNHPTTKHCNLAPPNQHQHKLCEQLIIHQKNLPKINRKLTIINGIAIRKPNSKSRQTHWKTLLKINQNSPRNPIQKQSKLIRKPIPNHTQRKTHMKSPKEQDLLSDLLPLLSLDLLPSCFPLLLLPDLPKSTVVCVCMSLRYERGESRRRTERLGIDI